MPLYLVRHAKAGSRSAWIGDDRDRPLVEEGWEQARALVARIAPLQPSALLSSPYLRCVQTLQPLGEECELDVTIDTRLEEDSPLERSLAALDDAPDNAVLCSHGDVIPDVINGLLRRGMDLVKPREPCAKPARLCCIVKTENSCAPNIGRHQKLISRELLSYCCVDFFDD